MNRLALILLILLLISCRKENKPDKTNSTSHIKYFGFTLIDTYWDDPTDNQTKTNYIDEVSEFSNIADILVVTPSDNIVTRMQDINSKIIALNFLIIELCLLSKLKKNMRIYINKGYSCHLK